MARGRAGDLVVLGARADSQFSGVAALGESSCDGGGVFIMDVLRVLLAGVSRAVPAERADAVSAERADAMRRRGWVKSCLVVFFQ